MHQPPQNLYEVWELYQLEIATCYSVSRAKSIISETQSALFRLVLFELNEQLRPAGRKMTAVETNAANESLQTLGLHVLLGAHILIKQGLEKIASNFSRKTYGNRAEQFLTWCKEQVWWSSTTALAAIPKVVSRKNERCPKVRRGHGKATQHHLTDRRSVYLTYKLQDQDINPELQSELDEFYSYWTDIDRVERFYPRIEESSARIYRKEILKMLGWFQRQDTPLEQLKLDLLVPKLTNDELEHLTPQEQDEHWHEKKRYLDQWLSKYFKFSREKLGSKSPKTKKFRTQALTALCKFQYRNEVGSASEHRKIPIFKAIKEHSNRVRRQVNEWDRHKQRVVPIQEKWPDIVEGQTALTTVQKEVTEELRRGCQPLYFSSWKVRSSSVIGTNLRDYLAWSFFTDLPARRQEEFRDLRVSLSCPIERPKDVPTKGLYQPLPPDQERELGEDNTPEDNYLYRTYVRKGKSYPQGIWVLDIRKCKTRNRYQDQSIIIKNRQFADGKSLYDYIEHYLYGWWRLSDHKGCFAFGWWNRELQDQKGHWLSLGRAEFSPRDESNLLEDGSTHYVWGFFFIKPRRGTPYNDSEFSGFFSTAAHRVIKKRINPHLVRNMWAAWAFQVGLTDHQRESLAYAMGMDIETMKDTYEHCSADEKRRPIEDVIDQVLFNELATEYQESLSFLADLADELMALPDEELQHYQQEFLKV